MIASPHLLYDTRRKPLPWPAMVREPVSGRSDVTSAPSRSGTETVASADTRAPSDPRPDDDDELRQIGERIAELAEGINAAEARMMALIADFDRRGGWKDGFGSCAEWLAWKIGITIGPARERVRAARALENLPQTADALRAGTISYAKVRALTRVATPESETELLEFARAGSAANLEQMVRMWKKRNTRGTNPGRKSYKVLQDCTICVSRRWTRPCCAVSRKREKRKRKAGLPHPATSTPMISEACLIVIERAATFRCFGYEAHWVTEGMGVDESCIVNLCLA